MKLSSEFLEKRKLSLAGVSIQGKPNSLKNPIRQS